MKMLPIKTRNISCSCCWISCLFFLGLDSISQPVHALSLNSNYESARNTRIIHGHTAAQPLYEEILANNPQDMTAATRIASSKATPARQDKACPWLSIENDDLKQFKQILDDSNYDNKHVHEMCGIDQDKESQGPLFLRPVPSGSNLTPPTLHLHNQKREQNIEKTSLICLVTLFLLGFAVPRRILIENMVGGNGTVELMEKLGLAFPTNEVSVGNGEELYIVPYVHIFPLDIHVLDPTKPPSKKRRCLRLVTDLHPTILCQTTVGEEGIGAVMYIGPDSLALVQHLPLEVHVNFLQRKKKLGTSRFHILDLCSGSGIQALATLVALDECFPRSEALCVDINERALRFTHFNAVLNNIDPKRLDMLNADIMDINSSKESQDQFYASMNGRRFDIILSNPPFIPVPQSSSFSTLGPDIVSVIQRRYGLFSSGGASGDIILGSVIKLSSRFLKEDGGLLAVVSEFMNPPVARDSEKLDDNDDSFELLTQIKSWWESGIACHGILFTNQYPLDAYEYSRRRASNEAEYMSWYNNLESSKIKSVSPGLLFLLTQNVLRQTLPVISIESQIIRKTEMGSIWTPYNKKAVTATREAWLRFCEAIYC